MLFPSEGVALSARTDFVSDVAEYLQRIVTAFLAHFDPQPPPAYVELRARERALVRGRS